MMLVILLNGVVVAVANVLTILVCFQLKTTTNKKKRYCERVFFLYSLFYARVKECTLYVLK